MGFATVLVPSILKLQKSLAKFMRFWTFWEPFYSSAGSINSSRLQFGMLLLSGFFGPNIRKYDPLEVWIMKNQIMAPGP